MKLDQNLNNDNTSYETGHFHFIKRSKGDIVWTSRFFYFYDSRIIMWTEPYTSKMTTEYTNLQSLKIWLVSFTGYFPVWISFVLWYRKMSANICLKWKKVFGWVPRETYLRWSVILLQGFATPRKLKQVE